MQLAAIFAADGHRITGNLESLPPDLRIDVRSARRRHRQDGSQRPASTRLSARSRGACETATCWCSGRNVDEAREISHVVGQALALGLLPGFCLCLLAGAWLSVRAQKRVEEVNQRVQRIIAGDLRERLPHRNVDEPFSKLAGHRQWHAR